MFPKISIVTPSYNQAQYLEETILSVLNQNYPNLEYIIIDGGSSDNSVEIIQKYSSYLKYWVSEKDTGQVNAINKGLSYCTGEIFNWLNSDDYLEKDILFKIAAYFEDNNINLVAGGLRRFGKDLNEYIYNKNLNPSNLLCWNQGVQFAQPSAWVRKKNIEICGGLDEHFHYAFDWDFYIRYLYFYPEVKYIPELVANFRLHEFSKTQSSLDKFAVEERIIIKKIRNSTHYSDLHSVCNLKIKRTEWTFILSDISKLNISFYNKVNLLFNKLSKYKEVAFSRQTIGAFNAFLKGRII